MTTSRPSAARTAPRSPAMRWFNVMVQLYCAGLFGWAGLHLFFGDRWGWLFLINSFAVYLFLPLLLLLPVALVARQRRLWPSLGLALALGLFFYGNVLLPRLPRLNAAGSTLTVMTFNVLGHNPHVDGLIAALRASEADLIALQELNPEQAAAIARDLRADYPYQILDAQPGVIGMGVISRYPLRSLDVELPGVWIGRPQALEVMFGATPVTLLNIHAIPPRFPLARLEWTIRERERQAETIVAFAAAHPGPLLVLGDLNATERSVAYATVTRHLADAWQAADVGLGHTFPGVYGEGSSRPAVAGIPVPQWLVRIDYIFHSAEWETLSARIGPWDGGSDHRPVLAVLALR